MCSFPPYISFFILTLSFSLSHICQMSSSLWVSNASHSLLRRDRLVPGNTYVARARSKPSQDSHLPGHVSDWSPVVSWDTPPGNPTKSWWFVWILEKVRWNLGVWVLQCVFWNFKKINKYSSLIKPRLQYEVYPVSCCTNAPVSMPQDQNRQYSWYISRSGAPARDKRLMLALARFTQLYILQINLLLFRD